MNEDAYLMLESVTWNKNWLTIIVNVSVKNQKIAFVLGIVKTVIRLANTYNIPRG